MPATPSSNPAPALPAELLAPLPRLSGIPEKRMALFAKLGIHSQKDLLFHLPSGLVERRPVETITEAKPGEVIKIRLEVEEHAATPYPSARRPYRVWCRDASGERIPLVFFHVKGDYVQRMLPIGETRVISGRVEEVGDLLSMPHPDYCLPLTREAEILSPEPVYPLTAGITNRLILALLRRVLPKVPALPEWQDTAWLKKQRYPDWAEAIRLVHQHTGGKAQEKARERLAYDELLAHQIALAQARTHYQAQPGHILKTTQHLQQQLRERLPFMLTEDQEKALQEMQKELQSGHRMVRLLQGDVGSGKTVVAVMLLLQAVEAGFQGALMAPTELLARQHHRTISAWLEPLGLRVELVTSATRRKGQREALASGEIAIAIGTHALIEQEIAFKKLGLAVIDEQHRFGVDQRLKLIEKATGTHVLMMSATPIPRTLAMTCYGDMELSIIRQKPAGRKPIETRVVPISRLAEVVEGLQRVLAKGARAYWVCPLVEESEELDLAAAEERFTALRQHYPRAGLVHGRMKPAERDPVMQAFRTGALDILVATTVIEVGVDVPEASVMIIEHAERFGLSQLHQLRGRVGRGQEASSCVLLFADHAGKTAKERLRVMRETEDGFAIAEADMQLRGVGDMVGKKQSGLPAFRHADLEQHQSLLTAARDDAAYLLGRDAALSTPRGQAVRLLLQLYHYADRSNAKLT